MNFGEEIEMTSGMILKIGHVEISFHLVGIKRLILVSGTAIPAREIAFVLVYSICVNTVVNAVL